MAEDVDKLIEQSKDTTLLIGVRRRRSAVEKMGNNGSPKVVVPLIQALDDEDKDVKRLAFMALNKLREPASLEILRNMYLKTRKKALWQVIKKNQFYPEGLPEKLDYLSKARAQAEIKTLITPENFEEVLDLILESELENKAAIIKMILEQGGEDVEMIVLKKFVASQNDDLFTVIDIKNWYPQEIDKKIMFLLKTERYEKLASMLDGADFRALLDILTDPKFPMKKQAAECLSHIDNPVIVDEICKIFLEENAKHLAPLILRNNWSPNHPRDKVFFYLKTPFLKGFFLSAKMDARLMGGFLEVPHVRKKMSADELAPLGTFLDEIAGALSSGDKPEIAADNPLLEMKKRVQEYIDMEKNTQIIREICDDFLETRNPFLGYLIVQMGWAPEDLHDKIKFYMLSEQEDKIKKLGNEAIEALYDMFTGDDAQEKERAGAILRTYKNPGAIDKIFRMYFSSMNQDLEKIISENDWKPSDEVGKALYFIFSGQPERYVEVEPKGFNVIFEAYKSLDTAQRFKLIEILIKHKAEYFVDFLLTLLAYEKNPRTLKLLCTILPVFFTKVYEPLKEKVKKMDGTVLREVIKTLAELKTEGSLEMMYEIAKVKMGYICMWVLKLLEEARWQPTDKRERAFFYELFKIRDEMIRMLKNNIVDQDPKVRERAAYDFSKMGDERLLTTLMKYAEDPDDNVRVAVAYSIGKLCALSPENALRQIDNFRVGSIYMIFNDVRKAFMVQSDLEQIQILSRNYEVGNIVLRIFAIAALEGLQKREGVPTLLKAMEDENKLVAVTALRSLRDIADSQAEEPLLKMISSNDEELRMLAAEALANVASPKTVRKLVRMLNSGEYIYADSLVLTLGKLDPLSHRALFERIIQRPDFSYEGKRAAIHSIGHIGDEEAARALSNFLKNIMMMSHKDRDLIPYIEALGYTGLPSVYQDLSTVMAASTWNVRQYIIKAMGNIPARIALVMVIKAMDDPSSWVQLAALESLGTYFNQHFKFKGTEKDLQFVAAIIGRLKKFHLNDLADQRADEIMMLASLSVLLLKHHFTKLYLEQKPRVVGK